MLGSEVSEGDESDFDEDSGFFDKSPATTDAFKNKGLHLARGSSISSSIGYVFGNPSAMLPFDVGKRRLGRRRTSC